MPSLHHREPGLIAALFEKKIYASIIADGIHVDFAMIRLAKELLGERLFLITDAVTEANEGVYQHVNAGDRYTMPDGTLSGSNLSMLKAVQNCVDAVGISLPEAINMASLYPAKLMGDDQKSGKIETGYRANLFSFTSAYDIRMVFMNGQQIQIDN
jgi:N-acetylglucosamine-6-phosphate deacetylase